MLFVENVPSVTLDPAGVVRRAASALKKLGYAVVTCLVDAADLGWRDDWKFVDFLARQVGVLAVPGSSFYARGGGKTRARVNFAKKEETLREAVRRLDAADLRARETRRRPAAAAR